jgi:hypothetical protein
LFLFLDVGGLDHTFAGGLMFAFSLFPLLFLFSALRKLSPSGLAHASPGVSRSQRSPA